MITDAIYDVVLDGNMKKYSNFNLGLFSQYRTALMGVATILIIFCHLPAYGVLMPLWIAKLVGSIGVGVDIFLFLSGLGMYNSYVNSKEHHVSVFSWWLKRYVRIVVPLVILVVPILLWNPWGREMKISMFWEISGWGALFNCSPLWFVTCILFLYLLTPFLHILFTSRYIWAWFLVSSFICYFYAYTPPYDALLHFMISRWPIYFFGYILAKNIKENRKGSIWIFAVLPLVLYMVFYFINHLYNMHFCLFGLQGVLMLTVFALMIDKVFIHNSQSRIVAWLNFMGIISLESYIMNEYFLRALESYNWSVGGIDVSLGGWSFYILGTCVSIFLSKYANKFAGKITSRF